jgi:hypothetical protein
MRKFILTIVPLILALITIILIKPSDEKCRAIAIERLSTINIQALTWKKAPDPSLNVSVLCT